MNDDTNAIRGFRFNAVAAGIKNPTARRLDLGLIVSDTPAICAARTTTNLVCAAPVTLTKKRLESGLCQAVLLNSGNANAYTGPQGLADAETLTAAVAGELSIAPEYVIPMSTGVIGNPLPVNRMVERIPDLVQGLHASKAMDVASAIMTTDTVPKMVTLDETLSTGSIRMVGMAKGAGMMAPNMATMLAVILVDREVELPILKECLASANERSFNCITVDGDTSTNDTVVVMSAGRGDAPRLGSASSDMATVSDMLDQICESLARKIVADGEGATKMVEVRVVGAPDAEKAAKMARTIAESPLVKTAFYGEDPNWGRIICAAGRAGVQFDPDRVDLYFGQVPVVKEGLIGTDDWESRSHEVMKAGEFRVTLDLKSGSGEATVLTTDLSTEYVRINADYRT